MNPNFWTVLKADALWSLCMITLAVLVQLAVKLMPGWWHRIKAQRKIARELQYCSPELFNERREELEIEYGLRPMPIAGKKAMPPGVPAHKYHACPHCGGKIESQVMLMPPGIFTPEPLGPGDSGAHPVVPVHSEDCPRCSHESHRGGFCKVCECYSGG